jgi:hypothetical protein
VEGDNNLTDIVPSINFMGKILGEETDPMNWSVSTKLFQIRLKTRFPVFLNQRKRRCTMPRVPMV